jgi:hypothetical protein
MSDSKLELERVHYEPGQTLASADLRVQVDGAAQLRWWHNRALHTAFGVAAGLEVSETQDTDGRRLALVEAGVAHDAFGRELILCERKRVQFPDTSHRLSLLLRYPSNVGRSRSLRRSVGEFVWKATRDWKVRDGVPLAYTDAAGNLVFRPWRRPLARPLTRPRVASGMTLPGATPWTVWNPVELGDEGTSLSLGFQTEIDTSSAGFTKTPCYFAWLEGSRLNAGNRRMLASREHLESETERDFIFCVWLPNILGIGLVRESGGETGGPFHMFARRAGLHVRWLALESLPSQSGKD